MTVPLDLKGAFSEDYKTLNQWAHRRSAPTLGTPLAVLHVAIAPGRDLDPKDTHFSYPEGHKKRAEGEEVVYRHAMEEQRRRELLFTVKLNILLLHIQLEGRAGSVIETFQVPLDEMKGVIDALEKDKGRRKGDDPVLKLKEFWDLHEKLSGRATAAGLTRNDAAKESIGFTLWWQKGQLEKVQGQGAKGLRAPRPEAIRVRVQVERYDDFTTVTFFLDADRQWTRDLSEWRNAWCSLGGRKAENEDVREGQGVEALGRAGPAGDPDVSLREKIAEKVSTINAACWPRIGRSDTDAVAQQTREHLREAADFLYDGIWTAFWDRFAIGTESFPGEIFASFRGLAMSVEDASVAAHDAPAPHGVPAGGDLKVPRVPKLDKSRNEAPGVLMAYWPFIQAVTSQSDYREYVGFGVLDRRGIYVTALGAESQYDRGDEGLPIEDAAFARGTGGKEPVRYLVLMKGKPQERRSLAQQLGRLLLVVNYLGTLRLAALKDIEYIEAAGDEIRARGQQLDEITRLWSEFRDKIASSTSGDKEELARQQNRYAGEIEKKLMHMIARLDQIGSGTGFATPVGGLSYRINRARYYIKSFNERVGNLRAKRIEGWMTYADFINRRLSTQFSIIDAVGTRLVALRERVHTALSGVQTGAIVSLTGATAENTKRLTQLQQSTDALASLGVLIAILSLTGTIAAVSEWKNRTQRMFTEWNPGTSPDLIGFDTFHLIMSFCFSAAILVPLYLAVKLGQRWKNFADEQEWHRIVYDWVKLAVAGAITWLLHSLNWADQVEARAPFGLLDWPRRVLKVLDVSDVGIKLVFGIVLWGCIGVIVFAVSALAQATIARIRRALPQGKGGVTGSRPADRGRA